jgi:hypothetical protein
MAGVASADHTCTASKIKATGTKALKKLICHQQAARAGIAADSLCLGKAETKFDEKFAHAEARPPCFASGDAAAIEANVDAFVADIATDLRPVLTASRCAGLKLKAAAQKAFAKLKCHVTAVRKGTIVDPVCLSDATTKFSDKFVRAEGEDDCLTMSDAAAIEVEVDAFVDDAVTALRPIEPTQCPWRKMVAVAAKVNDKLDCYVAAAKGEPVNGGCLANAEGHFSDRISSAESRGDCITLGDEQREAGVDAFVDDVQTDLLPTSGSSVCAELKLQAASDNAANQLRCYSEAYRHGLPLNPECLAKQEGVFSKAFNDAEKKVDCLTTGDAAAIEVKIDAYLADVIAALTLGVNCASSGDLHNERCTGDTSVKCSSAPGGVAGCGGALGTCEFWWGSNLPLSSGGVATCVSNQWLGAITGTFNQQTGTAEGSAAVLARVYLGPSFSFPCPQCVGDDIQNDGVAAGTCTGGARNGLACDGNGATSIPAFGVTSLDCPWSAGALIASQTIGLAFTNAGSKTIVVAAPSPNCLGAPGKKCACGVCSGNVSFGCRNTADCTAAGAGTCSSIGGEPAKPSSCVDDTSTGEDESLCAEVGGGEGECSYLPIDQTCAIETFRACVDDTDCQPGAGDDAPGDHCVVHHRKCYRDNGAPNGFGVTIEAEGSHTTPTGQRWGSTFAAVFCLPPTGSAAVNAAAGLPGPGRIELSGNSAENGISVTCPSEADFLPTARGGVLDIGWTGIAHDQRVICNAKVAVSVTGCASGPPNCGVCTYAGPILNPNANP